MTGCFGRLTKLPSLEWKLKTTQGEICKNARNSFRIQDAIKWACEVSWGCIILVTFSRKKCCTFILRTMIQITKN